MTLTAITPQESGPDKGKATGKRDGKGGEKQDAGGRRKLLVALVLVLALAGGGYWYFLKPAGGHATPVPGVVIPLEPIQVNLSGGHYLKIGVALQLVEGADEVDGSKALDAVIEQFSGRPMDELTQAAQRQKLKKQLSSELAERYDDEVMGVYFTDFVTQ